MDENELKEEEQCRLLVEKTCSILLEDFNQFLAYHETHHPEAKGTHVVQSWIIAQLARLQVQITEIHVYLENPDASGSDDKK